MDQGVGDLRDLGFGEGLGPFHKTSYYSKEYSDLYICEVYSYPTRKAHIYICIVM